MNQANTEFNSQIYEEASDWLVRFRTAEVDDADREALDEWLRRSPEHVRAYLEVSAIWEDAAFHDEQRSVDAAAHIQRARADGNVIPLSVNDGRIPAHRSAVLPRAKRRRRLAAAASIGAVGLL